MDEELTNQQSSPSQSSSTKQDIQHPINNQKGNFLIVIGVIILISVIGGGAYYLGMMRGKSTSIQPNQTQTNQPANNIVSQLSPSPSPSTKSIPSAKMGFQQYTNDDLRYGFSYSLSDALNKCMDIPCLSISRNSLRIEPLGTYEVDPNDAKASIMKADLFCSADGPEGSISCQDVKVEDYTNTLGFKGYKVLRTKVITGTGFRAGSYKDTAYVYFLPKVVKGQGTLDYAGILFAVDNPSQTNLSELNSIADTFFTY